MATKNENIPNVEAFKTALAPIKQFLDTAGNNKSGFTKRESTMAAVNGLLRSLLNNDSINIIKDLAGNGAVSIGIQGIGDSGKGNNTFLPSFNIRTPVVTIALNGTEIYPSKPNLDSAVQDEYAEQRVNFQNLSLNFPLGGVETSITGSLQLFTKDPKEILIPLDMFAKNATQNIKMTNNKLATGGLPIVQLTFGWAFSDSNAPGSVSKAISPALNFVVTNMTMSDPGTAGTTFNLTLHETGSLLLEHSSDDIIILANYPQEQLRTLLEGLLHTRLFTLDDLMYFNTKSPASYGAAPTPMAPAPPATTTAASPSPPPVDSSYWLEGLRILAIRHGYLHRYTKENLYIRSINDLSSYLEQHSRESRADAHAFYATLTSVQGGEELGPLPHAGQAQRDASSLGDITYAGWTYVPPFPTSTPSAAETAAVKKASTNILTAYSGTQAKSGWKLTEGDSSVPVSPSKTFFATTPNAAIGINGRNFLTVAKELASQCRCKWYPHDNTVEEVKKDDEITREATTRLSDLARDLKLVKQTPKNGVLSTDFSEKLAKDLKIKSNITDPAVAVTRLEDELRNTMALLATRCQLFWVPNIPADWKTLGSDEYSTGVFDIGLKQEYEIGAFFLLPDVLDDFNIFMSDLPVQYGPGASALPYFYGSGQNVFQRAKGGASELFGEVLSLSVNHSSLITVLANAANEKTAYAINGKYMTQLEAAINYTADSSRASEASRLNSSTTPAEEVKIAAAKKTQIKAIEYMRSTFNGSVATGKDGTLLITDMTQLIGKDRSNSGNDNPVHNRTGQAQTATYMVNSRVSSFLRYPTAAKISILGDPNLIRLGPGCFELLSYYPVQHDDYTVTQELNSLTSGLYFVNSIEHTISADNFITTLNGAKLVDPANIPSSITNKILGLLKTEAGPPEANYNDEYVTSTGQNNINQVSVVDLNKDTFTRGEFAKDLRRIFTEYKHNLAPFVPVPPPPAPSPRGTSGSNANSTSLPPLPDAVIPNI